MAHRLIRFTHEIVALAETRYTPCHGLVYLEKLQCLLLMFTFISLVNKTCTILGLLYTLRI